MKYAFERWRSWSTPTAVLYLWIPAGLALFLCGCLLSAQVFFLGRPFRFAEALISLLGARTDNPDGYGYAACGTALCGALLLPVGVMLRQRLGAGHPRWCAMGVSLIVTGLLAAIAIGVMAPFDRETYSQLHNHTAFLAFMSLTSGLAVSLTLAACQSGPWRWWLAALAGVEGFSFGFLIYIYFVPYPYDGYGPWTSLASLEWAVSSCIATSLVMLAAALREPVTGGVSTSRRP